VRGVVPGSIDSSTLAVRRDIGASTHFQATHAAAPAHNANNKNNMASHQASRDRNDRLDMAADDNDSMTNANDALARPSPSLSPHSSPGALRLADWGLIRAQGEEAAKFLHGQLTQDIEHLGAGQAVLAGYCSVKGRLLASFVVWRPAPDLVLLACSADLLAPVLKRLQMFVLRARCKLSDATAELPLWGLAGTGAGATAGAEGRADTVNAAVWSRTVGAAGDSIRLPDAVVATQAVPRWLYAGPAAPTRADGSAWPVLNDETWRALEVHSGVARVVAATSEQFVPQMVNLELVGGVNFQKGCYPGQEVVARSQYRGTIKRRAQVLSSPVPLQPGQEIFNSADPGQPAGLVVLAGRLGDDAYSALVELKLAALAGGSLHAFDAGGPLLQPTALPYAIPAEAD